MLAFDKTLAGLIPSDSVRVILRDSGIDFASMPAPEDRPDPAVSEVIASAAAEVVRLWDAVPLAQVLTGLPGLANRRVTPEDLPATTFYALHRHGITAWGDLAGLTGADLRGLPGVGPGSLHAIAAMALWQTLGLAREARHAAAARAHEPTGAVDTATGEEIGQLLLELNGRLGQTLVLVTHSPDLAARYAKRTVRLLDGRIASDTAAGGTAGADRRPGARTRP